MTSKEAMVAMRARIAKAETERDIWRTSGSQEKYLEAYSTVESLELQLEAMRQEGLRNTARAEALAEGLDARDADESRPELMAALGITFQDGVYRLGEYRYDRLVDAVNYARLRRLHKPTAPPSTP